MDKSLEAKKFLAVNQQSCNELLTFIDFAEGFTIGFVEINFPTEADIVIDFLKSHPQCEQIQLEILNFPDPNLRFLRDEIVKILPTIEWDSNKKSVLILRGLEKSIGVFGDYPPMLADLNFVRDAYSSSVPHPILFILPDYAITRTAKFAPDFWAWKSGVFHFQTTQIIREEAFTQFVGDERTNYQKYRLPEKQERIDLLERLLQEYRPSGTTIAKENITTCIDLLDELGVAYLSRREFIKAREYLEVALKVCQESGDSNKKAIICHDLGMVAQELREYEAAQQYYQQALDLKIEFGDRYSQDKTYNNLGMVARKLRQYEQARQYYQQALDILSELGDHYEQAKMYHNLGVVAQELREYEEARQYYQKALDICLEFGDRYSQASTYHNLGMVAQELREYEAAQQCYQQALDIEIEYGDRYSQASTYGQLGLLAEELGELAEAKIHLLQALEIYQAFNDEYYLNVTLINLARIYKASQDESMLTEVASILGKTVEEVRERFERERE